MAAGRTAVRWTEVAASDLEAIVDYVALETPGAAPAIAARVLAAVDGLARHPRQGRVVPELEAHGYTAYRELVIAPWRIVYRVAGTAVLVLAVVDGRRNLEDLLLERLIRARPRL